jgi:hypothetical protein
MGRALTTPLPFFLELFYERAGAVPLPTLRSTAIKLSLGVQTFRFGSL